VVSPLDPLSAFVAGVIGIVPRIVVTWVETRSRMRVEQFRADLAEAREQHNFERNLRLRYATANPSRIQSNAYDRVTPPTQQRSTAQGRTYTPPIPHQTRDSGRPAIVVASLPANADRSVTGVPHAIRRLLGEISGIEARAEVVPAVRVAASNVRGPADARALATTFGAQPTIVVYFTVSADRTLAAHAYLATVFGSTDGRLTQSFVVARYGRGSATPRVVAGTGDLPTYQHINLDALPDRSNEDVVAYTVTWFLLAVLDAYWRLKNGTDPGLLAQTKSVQPPVPPQRRVSNQFLPGAAEQRARLEQEASELAGAGFTVTAEEIDEQYVGMHARSAKVDVIFVVDATYPNTPPIVIRAGDTTIEIDDSDWTSECTLADIVEALQ